MTYILLDAGDHFFWAHCPWYWLWTLGAFLLGSLLTWLLTRGEDSKVDVEAIERDRDRYHTAATKWETDYQSIKYQLDESHKLEADLRTSLQRCQADKQTLIFAAERAAEATAMGIAAIGAGGEGDDDAGVSLYTGLFEPDNFQIIEGIGPKVNDVLLAAGYHNWSALAAAHPADLRAHLDAAGKNFGICDPTSWPHQASLAAAGQWDELIRYQRFTDAGRENVGDFENDSKFEKLAARKLGFGSSNPKDLKVIEGIGPKIEALLKADGIKNWSDLAVADVANIQRILDSAGPHFKMAEPTTWPQQAAMAAAGEWAALKALQDSLDGGR